MANKKNAQLRTHDLTKELAYVSTRTSGQVPRYTEMIWPDYEYSRMQVPSLSRGCEVAHFFVRYIGPQLVSHMDHASSPDRKQTHTHTHTTYAIRFRKHSVLTHTHTQSYDTCDLLVIITPRFYNIIASSPDRKHTHTHTHTHSDDACDPFVISTPRFYSIISDSSHDRIATHTHAHTNTHTTYAIRM